MASQFDTCKINGIKGQTKKNLVHPVQTANLITTKATCFYLKNNSASSAILSGLSVVILSTPLDTADIISASELTVQTFTTIPLFCASLIQSGLDPKTLSW